MTQENMTQNRPQSPKKRRLPRVCLVIFALAAVSAVLYFLFTQNAAFADWFNSHVSLFGRRVLSYLTVWIPFSFAEWLILLLPVFLVTLIVIGCRYYCDSKRSLLIYTGKLGSVLCAIWIIFVWNFAPGYYGTTLDQKLNLERREVSAEELYQTAMILSKQMNELSDELIFPGEDASSAMPYSYNEMNQKLMDAYEIFTAEYGFPDHFYSRVKPVMLSQPLSYTHITGI